MLSAAAVLVAAFLLIERRVTGPILPLSIFRLRTLAGANTAALLLGGSIFAFIALTYEAHLQLSSKTPAGP